MASFNIISFFEPAYTHDCDACRFYGQVRLRTDRIFGEKTVDVYQCPEHKEIVVRYGHNGPDYLTIEPQQGERFEIANAVIQMKGVPPKWTDGLIRERLLRDDRWLTKALVTIYNRQTDDEKQSDATLHDNGIGFNGVDAEFLSSLAQFQLTNGYLTAGRKSYARQKMLKYSKQLAKIANSKKP